MNDYDTIKVDEDDLEKPIEPYVNCSCGLEIAGVDAESMEKMFLNHTCSYDSEPTLRPPRVPLKFYEAVFSPPNVFFVCIAAIIIVYIIYG